MWLKRSHPFQSFRILSISISPGHLGRDPPLIAGWRRCRGRVALPESAVRGLAGRGRDEP